ncbi:uncharacterized protein [Nicotiana sylvestris]|uniref:uncharacterized protein n=1 Tax=Nicotiana sylvestris TaxID=4096 RepID=UPI00388C4540
MAINENESTSTIVTSSPSDTQNLNLVHHNHPLYIHPYDIQGVVLISIQLRGSKNYSLWSRSMKIVLHGKNKLAFMIGTCRKELSDVSLHELWDRCNAIVLAWIMNTIAPNLLSTMIYASNAHKSGKIFVRDLINLAPLHSCGFPESKQYVEHYQLQKLYQFLTGLNDSFDNAKYHIIMIRPLSNVKQPYVMIVNLESQSRNNAALSDGIGVSVTLMSKANSGNGNSSFKPRNNLGWSTLQCDYYHLKGHTKDSCYKFYGYPVDFKAKRRGYSGPQVNNAYNA